MAKFKKASADEARAKRSEHTTERAGGLILVKAATFKAPPSWNPEKRSARFIMSSESVDRYRDIVVQAGLETERFLENPQGLLFHNSRTWPCGAWSDIAKILNGRPRRTEGTLNFLPEGTDEDADRAARHVAAGSIKTVSIGFRPDWDEVEFILDDEGDWTGGFRWNKSELLECSLVPIPAQPDALVKDAGGDWRLARELVEHVLDTWARTPDGKLIEAQDFERSYRTVVEKIGEDLIEPKRPKWEIPAEHKGKFTAEQDAELMRLAAGNVNVAEVRMAELLDALETPAPSAEDQLEVFAALYEEGDEIKLALPAGGVPARIEIIREEKKIGELFADEKADGAEWFAQVHGHLIKALADREKPETKQTGTVSVSVDINTDEATQKVSALETLVDRVAGKFARFFGAKEVEPVSTPPAPPSAEEISAAIARAADTRARLASKGLIGA